MNKDSSQVACARPSVHAITPEVRAFYANYLVPVAQMILLFNWLMARSSALKTKRFREIRDAMAMLLNTLHYVNLVIASKMMREPETSIQERLEPLKALLSEVQGVVLESLTAFADLGTQASSGTSKRGSIIPRILSYPKAGMVAGVVGPFFGARVHGLISALDAAIGYPSANRAKFVEARLVDCYPLVWQRPSGLRISAWVTLARNAPWDKLIIQQLGWAAEDLQAVTRHFSSREGHKVYYALMAESGASEDSSSSCSVPGSSSAISATPVLVPRDVSITVTQTGMLQLDLVVEFPAEFVRNRAKLPASTVSKLGLPVKVTNFSHSVSCSADRLVAELHKLHEVRTRFMADLRDINEKVTVALGAAKEKAVRAKLEKTFSADELVVLKSLLEKDK